MADECGTYQPKIGLTFQQMKDMYAREGINAIMGTHEKPTAAMGSHEDIQALKLELRQKAALRGVQEDIFMTAEKSGWHDRDRELPEILALVHSEVSEALEAYRDGMGVRDNRYRYPAELFSDEDTSGEYAWSDMPSIERGGVVHLGKPEGVASELADVIVRILDASEELRIETIDVLFQKMKFNKTRPYKHGGKLV